MLRHAIHRSARRSSRSRRGVLISSHNTFGSLQPLEPRRLLSHVVPLGPEFLVNTYTASNQWRSAAAMDAEGDCFGESRLGRFLAEHADLAPGAIRDRLVAEIAGFVQGQPQHDDITMMILKIE